MSRILTLFILLLKCWTGAYTIVYTLTYIRANNIYDIMFISNNNLTIYTIHIMCLLYTLCSICGMLSSLPRYLWALAISIVTT